MALSTRLELVERGEPAILSPGEWEGLAVGVHLDRLSKARVLGYRVHGGFVVVEPRNHVGVLRVRNRSIVIQPKLPDVHQFTAALAAQAEAKRLRQEDYLSAASKNAIVDPARRLCRDFEEAVATGFPFAYQVVQSETSSPRGKILWSQTGSRLLSRGVKHKVFAARTRRAPNPLVACVARTSFAVLKGGPSLPDDVLTRIDRYEDHLREGPGLLVTKQAIATCEDLLARGTWTPQVQRLLETCQKVLTNQSQLWDFEQQVEEGECRFVNTDRLWEVATQVTFESAVQDRSDCRVTLHPFGGNAHTLLFPPSGPEIDPDVVLFKNDSPACVIDAKYSSARAPDAQDVYQILAYAQRLVASAGILVYVAETGTGSVVDLGTWDEKIRILAVFVPQQDVARRFLELATEVLRLAGT